MNSPFLVPTTVFIMHDIGAKVYSTHFHFLVRRWGIIKFLRGSSHPIGGDAPFFWGGARSRTSSHRHRDHGPRRAPARVSHCRRHGRHLRRRARRLVCAAVRRRRQGRHLRRHARLPAVAGLRRLCREPADRARAGAPGGLAAAPAPPGGDPEAPGPARATRRPQPAPGAVLPRGRGGPAAAQAHAPPRARGRSGAAAADGDRRGARGGARRHARSDLGTSKHVWHPTGGDAARDLGRGAAAWRAMVAGRPPALRELAAAYGAADAGAGGDARAEARLARAVSLARAVR